MLTHAVRVSERFGMSDIIFIVVLVVANIAGVMLCELLIHLTAVLQDNKRDRLG